MATYYSHEQLNYSVKPSKSQPVRLSELDLFSSIGVQEEIEESFYERVYSVQGNLDQSSPQVVFNIPASTMMTSLNDSYMVATVHLKKYNDTTKVWEAPAATEHVCPVNNTLYSLWKGIGGVNWAVCCGKDLRHCLSSYVEKY